MRYSVPRKSRRVPLVTDVHLKLEEVADPVTATTINVSLGGMSVDYPQPPELGSLAAFELEIGDALVEGTGEVAWVRAGDEAGGRPAGMGIRFRYLSPGSRERIFRLVQWYAKQEGVVTPEDVAAAAATGLAPPVATARPAPAGPAGRPPHPPPPGRPIAPAAEAPAATRLATAAAEPASALDETAPLPSPPDAPALPTTAFPRPQAAGRAGKERPFATAGEDDETLLGLPPERVSWPRPPQPPRFGLRDEPADALPDPDLEIGPGAGGSELRRPAFEARGFAYRSRERRSPFRWVIAAGLLLAALAIGYLARERLADLLGVGTAGAALNRAAARTSPPAPSPAPPAPSPAPPAAGTGEPAAPSRPPAAPQGDEPGGSAETRPLPRPDSPHPRIEPSAGGEAPSPMPPRRPARAVERISWLPTAAGTAVTIEADGAVSSADYSSAVIADGNPRLLLRVRRIERPYRERQVEVGTAELRRIRFDLKPDRGGELWVVFDLASPGVRLASIEETGSGLRLVLAAR